MSSDVVLSFVKRPLNALLPVACSASSSALRCSTCARVGAETFC